MDDLAYLSPPTSLEIILERTRALGFEMSSEPRVGALLRVLAASKPGGRILELGTGTGISAAWLLDGMDRDAQLISVDTNADSQTVALDILGSDPRLKLVTEDGTSFIRRQAEGSFDLIFADAMPGKYEALNDVLILLRIGGLYVVDDMLPQTNWPDGHGSKVSSLLTELSAKQSFEVARLAWSSGLVILARND